MRLRLSASILLLSFVVLLSMGNRNGRAASQNRGNTGAPGDETISGLPRTCANCHGGSSTITASIGISVLDSMGNNITSYVPRRNYQAKVTITATGTGLGGYGFQMIALRNNGNVDVHGFSDPGSNNFKIATISNGRSYAEHDNISNSNTFSVPWKAPAAGTGSVTFYAAGNGVNRNNNSSGDGSASSKLVLTESVSVSSKDVETPAFEFALSPNPTRSLTQLRVATLQSGPYQLAVYNSAGYSVWSESLALQAENAMTVPLNVSEWPTGVYIVRLFNQYRSASKKLVIEH